MKRFQSFAACSVGILSVVTFGDLAEAFHSIVPHQSSTVRTGSSSTFSGVPRSTLNPPFFAHRQYAPSVTALQSDPSDDVNNIGEPNLLEKLIASMSKSSATKLAKKYNRDVAPFSQSKFTLSVMTFARVFIPSVAAGIVAYLLFPALALFLCTTFNDAGVFAVLSQDSSQFVQNFLTVAGLLFSILVGQVRVQVMHAPNFRFRINQPTISQSLLFSSFLVLNRHIISCTSSRRWYTMLFSTK